MLFVLDVQVFECGDKGLSLESSCSSSGDWGVADGALSSNSDDVTSQWSSKVTSFVPSLSHTADMETTAKVDAVQNLRRQRRKLKTTNLATVEQMQSC